VSVVSEEDQMAVRTVFRVPGADQSNGGEYVEAAQTTRENLLATAAALGRLIYDGGEFYTGSGTAITGRLTPLEMAIIYSALREMTSGLREGGH
jgi:hypothetical protein